MLSKVTFIINPIFGINRRPAKIIGWIHDIWKDKGIAYTIEKTAHRGHGTELAREAVKRGAEMVVAVGGDGTINEVGEGLIGSNAALGVVPAGSGNGFARNMKIPLKQKLAIEALLSPRFRQIDIGKINEFYFFNVAGAGLDAAISNSFDHVKMRGPLPYFYIGVREFFRYTPDSVVIHFNNREELIRMPMLLSFANLPQFGVGATIAPNAKPDDGLLDVCILSPMKLGSALKHLPKLFNGKIDRIPEMEIYQASEIYVQRNFPLPIHTDGDPRASSGSLRVKVLPGAIKLALPG